MTLRTFFPYILYVNDVITPGAVNFRNQSEPVRVNISGDDQWFIFRKLIDDASDAIFNVAVKSKTSLDLSILSTKHSVTPYIFYIKPPSWIEGKIESIGVQYRSGSTDKSVLEQTIKFIFVEYFIHTCLTLLKVQSFPIFYQLFYKQRPVKFSITVHITDTGTLKQTIFFTNISPSGENL